MKKKLLLCLGFLGLVMTLVPTTLFAATSVTHAGTHTPHAFFQKGKNHNHNQPATQNASSAANSAVSTANMTYHGGPVMNGTMNVYLIFWQPTNNVSASYQTLIQRYFNDIGGSPLYQLNQQYTDAQGHFPSGSHLAGTWVDSGNAYPVDPSNPATVYDTDIQTEVTRAQQANGWTSSMSNIFFVFTERNENVCFKDNTGAIVECTPTATSTNAFCAYHNYFGTDTLYATMPYAASSNFANGCQPELGSGVTPNHDDADLTINVTSHEQIEAATDPLLNAWYDSNDNEIGDKCAWTFSPVDAASGDVKWNNHSYLVQQEWDNVTSSCKISPNSPAYYEVVNRKSGLVLSIANSSTSSGAQVTIDTNRNGSSQQWSLVPNGDAYQLVNRKSGLVLTVSGASTSSGANLILSTNHTGGSQRWWLFPEGGYDVLVNTKSLMVAWVSGGSTSAGAHVVQSFYKDTTSQQWALVPVYYVIKNVKSGLVMGIAGSSTSANAQVIQTTASSGSTSQEWTINPDGSTYQLVNRKSGLVMGTLNSSSSAGASIVQNTNHNGPSQQWRFLSSLSACLNGSTCQLQSAKSGFVLDVSGGVTTSGASLIQTPNQNTSSQQWVLVPVAE